MVTYIWIGKYELDENGRLSRHNHGVFTSLHYQIMSTHALISLHLE